MNQQTRKPKLPEDGFMTAPGYPFSARDIFGDLRSRLSTEHRRPMSFERLAKMLGRSKSTTYNWFDNIKGRSGKEGFLPVERCCPTRQKQRTERKPYDSEMHSWNRSAQQQFVLRDRGFGGQARL
jgi:hypothetical protein